MDSLWRNRIGITLAVAVCLLFVGHRIFSSTTPMEITFTIAPGDTRSDVAEAIGEELRWKEGEREAFAATYVQMQWAAYNTLLDELLTERFDWGDAERETFLINSTQYFESTFDFLSTVHVPGDYTIPGDLSMVEIAGALIERQQALGDDLPDARLPARQGEAGLKEFIEANLHEAALERVADFVATEVELLPDLAPLPPQDLTLTQADGEVLLSFSTIYFNQGEGPLELRADPATAGIRDDIERDVFQRIYRTDGSHRDELSGTFLWHQPHLHYHFADFVVYDLEAVDVPGEQPDLDGVQAKSTFCIRDVSHVDLELSARPEDAAYRICGKERQGISVGWADTYFYTYPDQNLNLTGLPSGTYRLSFIVNPEDRFKEVTRDNNTSSATFELDMDTLEVRVLEEFPSDAPSVEHIYYEQDFE